MALQFQYIDLDNVETAVDRLKKRMPMFDFSKDENRKIIADDEGWFIGVKRPSSSVVSIDTGTNIITANNHKFNSGISVWFTSTYSPPSGLLLKKKYYISKVDDNSFRIHVRRDQALAALNPVTFANNTNAGRLKVELLITEPFDFGFGAIANVLEWNKNFSYKLIEDFDFRKAGDRIIAIDYILNDFFGIPRYYGETDDQYAARVNDALFKFPQVTEASIRVGVLLYGDRSDTTSGVMGGFFMDSSHLDAYSVYKYPNTFKLNPAIFGLDNGLPFYVVIVVSGIDAQNIQKVIGFISAAQAAGIAFTVFFDGVRG